MRMIAIAVIIGLGTGAPAAGDVFVGHTDSGTLLLTNLPRSDQRYQQVFREPSRAKPSARLAAPMMSLDERPYAQHIARAAQLHDLPEALLHAVIRHESNYDAAALSPAGAAGLMQLMPALHGSSMWQMCGTLRPTSRPGRAT